ncbi:MAG: hypothetical protein ACE5FG_09330 [Myxococcota bacterium]
MGRIGRISVPNTPRRLYTADARSFEGSGVGGDVGRDVDCVGRGLCEGRWTHDHPIAAVEARKLGLNVSTEMPREFIHLMNLFPQPVRRTPTAEYIPVPRRLDDGGRSSDD